MPDRTQEYLQLAEQTARSLTNSYESWTGFLETSSRLYKYDYQDQLMIYAQRPEATACASYELWNNSMHRYVKRGSRESCFFLCRAVGWMFAMCLILRTPAGVHPRAIHTCGGLSRAMSRQSRSRWQRALVFLPITALCIRSKASRRRRLRITGRSTSVTSSVSLTDRSFRSTMNLTLGPLSEKRPEPASPTRSWRAADLIRRSTLSTRTL